MISGQGSGISGSETTRAWDRVRVSHPCDSEIAWIGHEISSLRTHGRCRWFTSLLFVAGCRQDMQDQPKIISQRGSEMFADHRGARPQVVNTVARGQLHEDSYFYTGVVQGANGYREEKNEMPFPVTLEVLKRGQERFNIYCTPCHSRVGNGLGEIVQRGYKPAANSARSGAALAAHLALLLRDDARLRSDAGLLGATDAGGSLGSGGVYSRVAVEPGGKA